MKYEYFIMPKTEFFLVDRRDDFTFIRESLLKLVDEDGVLQPPEHSVLNEEGPSCVQKWVLWTTIGRKWWQKYNEELQNNEDQHSNA